MRQSGSTRVYDLFFRNYDPAIGRMHQVDPVAAKYASLTPYNYSFNNPAGFSDPSGADPDLTNPVPQNAYYFHNGAGAAGYPGLTYDDWIPQNTRGEYNNAFGWRTDQVLGWLGGSGSMGDWRNGLPMSAVMFLSRALESSNGGAWNGGDEHFYSHSETMEFTRGANAGGSGTGGNSIFRTIGSFLKRLFGGKNQILNISSSVIDFEKHAKTVGKGRVVVGLRIYGGDILTLPTEGYNKKGKRLENDGWNWSIDVVKTRTWKVSITLNDGEKVSRTRLEVKHNGAWHGVTELLLSVPDIRSMDRYDWFKSRFIRDSE